MAASPDVRVAKIATRQHGLITSKQAAACGLSPRQIDRRVTAGRWERVHPGVYRIAGAERSWRQEVLAACLSAGEGAVASHLTAGVLWDLIERRRSPIELTVPIGKHPQGLGFVVHRSRLAIHPCEYSGVIPVTSVVRTIIDLSGAIGQGELEEALDIAIRRRLITPVEVGAAIERLRGRRGIGELRGLVSVRVARKGQNDGVFASRFERILRQAALPAPEIEYEIRRGGQFVARVDLAYPRERVVIELDSYSEHSSRRAFDSDRIRQNALEDAGYAVRRFTWSDLDRPKYAIGVVRRILWERGHPDVVSV